MLTRQVNRPTTNHPIVFFSSPIEGFEPAALRAARGGSGAADVIIDAMTAVGNEGFTDTRGSSSQSVRMAGLCSTKTLCILAARPKSEIPDEFRNDRPYTVVNKNVDAVRRMIEINRHVTDHEIWASLAISMSQIRSIIDKQLDIKRLCSRWIPHNLTEA
ncbi:hypothetical protein EVAR_62359_1 [Eumeta japonica]|uniref:Uncharacterized protein n=1 Tax=Eumeta variegata TaxID=151549 RepID=A0A4C2A487_EUMVA|nr:hypothetical protein EVAR_62359_1 [Eumeta japonica]